jgi:hypothetical protein
MEVFYKTIIEEHVKRQQKIIRKTIVATQSLRADIQHKKEDMFRSRHGENAVPIFWKYTELVKQCCGSSDEGYEIWLESIPKDETIIHGIICKGRPGHWVVLPELYKRAQPTEIEREAYYVVMEKEIEIPQKIY